MKDERWRKPTTLNFTNLNDSAEQHVGHYEFAQHRRCQLGPGPAQVQGAALSGLLVVVALEPSEPASTLAFRTLQSCPRNPACRGSGTFNFSNVGTSPTWRDRYDDYVTVSGLGQAPEDIQVRSLLYFMGPEARPLLNTFSLDAASLASYAAVVARFTAHFVHPANELYESSRFHKRIQQPDESVDAYYAELCKLVKRCNYPSAAIEERLVRDRFVVGLRDTRLLEQLCRNAKLTLTETWTQARQSEDADKERASARPSNEISHAVQVDSTKKDKVPSRRRSDAKCTWSSSRSRASP